MLAARGSIRGDIALPHLLDVYRRQCESIRPFVYALSEVIQALDGRRRLEPTLGYEKRVELTGKSQYGKIVDCLDPQIRHSESHGGTDIDHERGAIILGEGTVDGLRRTIREYSYWQFADIARNLEHGLYMAIIAEFALIQLSTWVLITHSVDYAQLSFAIDNMAGLDEPVTQRREGDVSTTYGLLLPLESLNPVKYPGRDTYYTRGPRPSHVRCQGFPTWHLGACLKQTVVVDIT